jgi:hypothetical protein
MRNELDEAKNCLERACPLMELLPGTILDTFETTSANFGIMNEFGFIRDSEIDESLREQMIMNDADDGKNYAENCFAMLRNVYEKLYGINSTSTDENEQEESENHLIEDENRFSSHYDDFSLYDDDEERPADGRHRSRSHHTGDGEGAEEGGDDLSIESRIEELRIPFQHLRSELQMIYESSHQKQHNNHNHRDDTSSGDFDGDRNDRFRSRSSSSEEEDEEGEGTQELTNNVRVKSVGRMKKKRRDTEKEDREKKISSSSASSDSNPSFPPSSFSLRDLFFNPSSSVLSGDSNNGFRSESGNDLPISLGSGPASIIAADLEAMLRKFVREDEEGRKVLFKVAKKYYDDLSNHFPTVSLSYCIVSFSFVIFLLLDGRECVECSSRPRRCVFGNNETSN